MKKDIYIIRNTENDFTLSKNRLDRLIYDLKYSTLSYEELGNVYGISTNQVKAINYGSSWHMDYLKYPIRSMVFNGDDTIYTMIQKDLLSTSIPYEEICKKYSCSFSTVNRINNGDTAFNELLSYPLRRVGKLSSTDVLEIHKLLVDDDISINDIAKRYGVSDATIKRINSGKTKKYYDERFSYPLRK